MNPLDPPALEAIRAARGRIDGLALRTPLLPLQTREPAPAEIHLKLENLQPIGSFKLRGAGNRMHAAKREELAGGVWTASAGNMAQGVAWVAREMGLRCQVVVPDHAPRTKIEAIHRLGGETLPVPFARWWQVLMDHAYPGLDGLFLHPVSDPVVQAGNGTIGLEILEDLPEVETVIVPFGGGGLSCGIAAALRALKPEVKILAAEVETAAPLTAALAAGEPREIAYTASFVDGIGGRSVLAEMWPLARRLLDGAVVVSLEEVAAAIRLLAEQNRVIAEGAGAAAVAAALSGRAGNGKTACVVSGGNLEPAKLAAILEGRIPS